MSGAKTEKPAIVVEGPAAGQAKNVSVEENAKSPSSIGSSTFDAEEVDETPAPKVATEDPSMARQRVREKSVKLVKKVMRMNSILHGVDPSGTPSRPSDLKGMSDLIKPNYRDNLSKMKVHERTLYLQKAQDHANKMTRRSGWFDWVEKREAETKNRERMFRESQTRILNTLEELVPTSKVIDFPDEDEIIV